MTRQSTGLLWLQGAPRRGSRYRVMAQQSPKELLSPLSDCRQHCWVVEIISSKYTWLKDSCLTASSVRQFVQHKMCLNTCHCRLVQGAVAPHWACPASATGASITFHGQPVEITANPRDVLLPPAHLGPCVHSCPSTALPQPRSHCWHRRKTQLWMQHSCCLQAKQSKPLEMQVPVQVGGLQWLSVPSQELSAAHKITISGQFWGHEETQGSFRSVLLCPGWEQEQNPGVSVSGEAHVPARPQRAAAPEHFSRQDAWRGSRSSSTISRAQDTHLVFGAEPLLKCIPHSCVTSPTTLNTSSPVSARAFNHDIVRLCLDLRFPTVTISCRIHSASWGHFSESANKNYSPKNVDLC